MADHDGACLNSVGLWVLYRIVYTGYINAFRVELDILYVARISFWNSLVFRSWSLLQTLVLLGELHRICTHRVGFVKERHGSAMLHSELEAKSIFLAGFRIEHEALLHEHYCLTVWCNYNITCKNTRFELKKHWMSFKANIKHINIKTLVII